jgi:hypothetical protein
MNSKRMKTNSKKNWNSFLEGKKQQKGSGKDMTEKEKETIDWMDTFVLREHYQTAYEILMKIDEIVRVYSAADGQPKSWDSLIKRQDAFSRDVGRLVLRAVQMNLDADTVMGQYKAGCFPKYAGEPGFSHLLYNIPRTVFLREPED